MKDARAKLEERKGRYLQRIYRGYKGRNRAWLIKAERENIRYQQNRASEVIQRNIRSHRINVALDERISKKQRIYGACTKMQALVRSHLARLHIIEMVADMRELKEEWASIKIQTRWLVCKAKIRVAKIRR